MPLPLLREPHCKFHLELNIKATIKAWYNKKLNLSQSFKATANWKGSKVGTDINSPELTHELDSGYHLYSAPPPNRTEQGSAENWRKHTPSSLPNPGRAPRPAWREGLTIACSTAARRSAGTRRAAANRRLHSPRNQAPGFGRLAGWLQA